MTSCICVSLPAKPFRPCTCWHLASIDSSADEVYLGALASRKYRRGAHRVGWGSDAEECLTNRSAVDQSQKHAPQHKGQLLSRILATCCCRPLPLARALVIMCVALTMCSMRSRFFLRFWRGKHDDLLRARSEVFNRHLSAQYDTYIDLNLTS